MPVPLPAPFGKYQLLAHVAEGGMADVYLARLPGPGGFEKRLVVKVIRPHLAERREFCELFVAEAKITVSLSHGNIVPVYELGMVAGQYFMTMELVDGPTLHDLVFDPRPRRGGPLPAPVSAYIMEQVLRGLDYAHRQGVIHRDLSLANVLCSREGEVKIVDFGIAAKVHAQRLLPHVAGGSEGYMAPEQLRNEAPDARVDIYAAGVVLAEIVTGLRFTDDLSAVALQTVPSALQRIVATATAADPGQRYADAAAMLAELSRYLREVEAPTQSDLARITRQRAPDERRPSALLPRISTRHPGETAPRLPPRGPSTREIPRVSVEREATPLMTSAAAVLAPPTPEREPPVGTVIFASRPAPIQPTWRTFAGAALLLLAVAALALRLAQRGTPPALAVSRPARAVDSDVRDRGNIYIDVPAGASLRIDGRDAVSGKRLSLPVGPHRIEAQAAGHRPVIQIVELRRQETLRERLVLPWAVGRLALRSLPTAAAVQLDGAAVGSTPLMLDVPLDRPALLRLSAHGHGPTTRTILPEEWTAAGAARGEDQQPELHLDLTLRPVARGALTIGALPWAQVYVDGEYRGDTPLRRQPIAAGAHALRLHCPPPGCPRARDLEQSITITPGRELLRSADFRASPPIIIAPGHGPGRDQD